MKPVSTAVVRSWPSPATRISISKTAWAKLDADTQKIFMEEAKASQQEYLDWIDKFEEKAKADITAAGGVVKAFPADELAKWKAAAPDLLGNWVEDMKSRGLGDDAEMIAAKEGVARRLIRLS